MICDKISILMVAHWYYIMFIGLLYLSVKYPWNNTGYNQVVVFG